MEEIWQNAVRVSASQERGRMLDVAGEVATRLERLRRYNSAASLFKVRNVFCFLNEFLIFLNSWPNELQMQWNVTFELRTGRMPRCCVMNKLLSF